MTDNGAYTQIFCHDCLDPGFQTNNHRESTAAILFILYTSIESRRFIEYFFELKLALTILKFLIIWTNSSIEIHLPHFINSVFET